MNEIVAAINDDGAKTKSFAENINANKNSTRLHKMLRDRHADPNAVYALLKMTHTSASVSFANSLGHYPLHIAASSGNLKFVDMVYTEYPDAVNFGSHNLQFCPLHISTKNGHVEIVRYLLDVAPATAYRDSKRGLPIHVAVAEERFDIIRVLISRFPSCCGIPRAVDGVTPLHIASTKSRTSIRYLMEHDRTLADAQDRDGNYCYHFAAAGGHLHCLKALLELAAAADRSFDQDRCLQRVNHSGCTPLYAACSRGHAAVVDHLVTACPAALRVKAAKGTYPIHAACQGRHTEVIALLLQVDPGCLMLQRTDSLLPLHMALRSQSGPCSEALLRILISAFPSALAVPGESGITPYDVLCRPESLAINPLSSSGSASSTTTNAGASVAMISLPHYPLSSVRLATNALPTMDWQRYRDVNWESRRCGILLSFPTSSDTGVRRSSRTATTVGPAAATTAGTGSSTTTAAAAAAAAGTTSGTGTSTTAAVVTAAAAAAAADTEATFFNRLQSMSISGDEGDASPAVSGRSSSSSSDNSSPIASKIKRCTNIHQSKSSFSPSAAGMKIVHKRSHGDNSVDEPSRFNIFYALRITNEDAWKIVIQFL